MTELPWIRSLALPIALIVALAGCAETMPPNEASTHASDGDNYDLPDGTEQEQDDPDETVGIDEPNDGWSEPDDQGGEPESDPEEPNAPDQPDEPDEPDPADDQEDPLPEQPDEPGDPADPADPEEENDPEEESDPADPEEENDPEEGEIVTPIDPGGDEPEPNPFIDLQKDRIFFQVVAGVGGSAYHDMWASARDLGYAPTRLEGLTTPSGGSRYSGIWTKDANVAGWASRRGLSSGELATLMADYGDAGLRAVNLDAHVVDGETRFHAIWLRELDAPADWDADWDLDYTDLIEAIEDWDAAGLRPITLNSYRVAGETQFAVVAVADGREWQGIFDTTSDGYGSAWSAYREQGFVPIDISSHIDGDDLRFNGLWARDPDVTAWQSTRELSFDSFEELRIARTAQNYVMIDVDAYYRPGESQPRYSGIWVRRPRRNLVRANVPLSGSDMSDLDALLRSYTGTIGFYVEDLTNGNYLALNHHEHFYMASTTKVFIAARVLALIDEEAIVGGAPLTLDRQLPFRAVDYRQAADDSVLQVGQSYTVDQYLRWMINRSSTGATDRMHGLVANDLDAFIAETLGLQNVGEVTSICELDTRVIEQFDSCYREVPCHVLEPWWRDRNTSDPDYGDYQSCLGSPGSLRRPSGTSTFDELYSTYYATLANSITPAAYGRFWRNLVGGELLSEASTNVLIDILDGTGNGYVDDFIINQGYFNGLGGKHGGKRKSRSWVGLAWFRNGSNDVADATHQYSIAIFTENWASSGDDQAAKDVINQSLGFLLSHLDAQR